MGCLLSSDRSGETKIDTAEMMIDWSDLPSDIAKLIAERVATNLVDYINFRAVCPSWRAVTVDPCHLEFPPQLPWFLLETRSANPLPFTSISGGRPRSLPLPEATGKTILFSSDGWLVMEESPTKISLLNPLTRRLIHLPPLPPCEDICEEDMKMLAMAIPSSSSANSTIMAIVGNRTKPLVTTPTMLIGLQSGLSAWTIVNKTQTFHDIIYYKESFYTTSQDQVLVFNAELKEVMGSPVPVYCFVLWRFVESSGNLLMVKRAVAPSRKRILYRMYKFSSIEGSLRFERVEELGGQIIFLSTHGRAVSLPAKDHPPHKANKIYFETGNILGDRKYLKLLSEIDYALSRRLSLEESTWTSPGDTATWHMPRLC